ncbi:MULTISPECIES: chemotaxis protein CheD [Vibrio]|uniref:Probable chemoreceptor glutamine deamidase CheD n=1 Tax=Vibrio aestuarianus TaxID=28171 RepID=A0A9X4F1Y7_9VIBR|nr:MULTISPECIES: chemotaxis protein CheD [Vibrio]KOE88443.1 chemotaxis protein CheD [Vibrio alginolyticus]MDE1208856.1 chemotaxis protein CheD [Vibrio aestuarianus]MDE1213118.1 chemotaxis protein CheD [Vibrio aestuarianus]MDE1218961.1 chemotaxis protein CheD [Vibrio aestuarianus]MDE1224117.1 chemotaxis protein CheD [Vibrio aestuarianus]
MASSAIHSTEDNRHFNRFHHPQKNVDWVKVLPGGIYCTNRQEIICTGLGSCVAACIWDPEAKVGGMNHFLLPFDNYSQIDHWKPDEVASTASRYGCYAMELLINQLIKMGADRQRLRVKLFGGAQMLDLKIMIGQKNIDFITRYAKQEQLIVAAKDLGGCEPRKVMFDPLTGRAWLKRIPFSDAILLSNQEKRYATQLERETHNKQNDAELFE